ncbi:PREDICTED: probable LRR receptor-like serine/threonine-protein kinase At1g51810 [Camelina sativa]|uniref:Probable LRR receptor-like serine/threonine-protein kinase At1g51810 n=1 Tax=Camelina sativa TaxID=90675 RepID=A0ABM1R9J7_CAMSA|nr:PREDICTED: probable LRR receptor-like serine/threonine-protein kinase At1g51810 [Camelina sativa]
MILSSLAPSSLGKDEGRTDGLVDGCLGRVDLLIFLDEGLDEGSGSPFINTLELRPLDPNAYRTTTGSLKKLVRVYISNSTDYSIRYPDDVYDRDWHSYFVEKLWLPITMGLSLDTNDNEYDPPERVMQTAAIPIDANATLEVEWSAESPTTQFYAYLYFSELQILQANDTRTREFNVFLKGAFFHEPISPEPLRSTVFNDGPKLCTDGKCVLQLKKTSRSTLPPILSALEVYTVMDILQLETNDDDVNGIKDVQDTYDWRRITWQGDPCVPKQFLWEGLNCNQSDNSTPPTIISLDLSSSGLTGVIAEAIQSLVHLQQLDLSNNSFSGGVPDFLADMKSLFLM